MKKNNYILLIFLLLAVAGLGSCSGEEDYAGNEPSGGQSLSVIVNDAGYLSAAKDGIGTKATEQGYTTAFTAGDQIGVFAVKDNQIITEVNNLCLTASMESSTLVWKDAGGNTPLKFTGATYYAYYPYQSTLAGTPNALATDAAGFFSDVVSNWTPATEQGTYANYTANDLMIAEGTISSNNLSFAMQHQMALVVIELPGTKYEFSNTSPTVPDYITDPLDTQFDGYTPYRMTDGAYRYLVHPSSTSPLTGGYTDGSGTAKGWEFTPAGLNGGKYKTLKIDGGIPAAISHNLQGGDFIMKDGTLVGKDEILTAGQQVNCAGIVFWVGDPTKGDHNNGTDFTDFGDPALQNEHPGCTHGLVVALQDADANKMKWQNTASAIGNAGTTYQTIATNAAATDALNKLRGYNNTQVIRRYNNNVGNGSLNFVLPVQAIDTWATTHPAPANSSGWYFPSEKELTLLCGKDIDNIWHNILVGTDMRDIVNVSIGKVTGATAIAATFYWSSSEGLDDTFKVFTVRYSDSLVSSSDKPFDSYYVRSVLAF